LLFLSISSAFCIAGKTDGDAAEEPGSSAISATGAGDLAASHDVAGRGGFLSAAVAPVAADHQRRVRREKIIGPIGSAPPRPHGEERVFARLEP
jgi:hypothetical protein